MTITRTLRRTTATTAAALSSLLLIAACTGPGGQAQKPAEQQSPSASSTATEDPATKAACLDFFGDPDYLSPKAYEILGLAGSVAESTDGDTQFFASGADTLRTVFQDADDSVRTDVEPLMAWFQDEAPKGSKADMGAFADAYRGVAAACSGYSQAAAFDADPANSGKKPAKLVCSELSTKPQTLGVFGTANVLPSEMFRVVGLSPRTVSADDMDTVKRVNDYLEQQKRAVDDEGVAAAIGEIQKPFTAALDGDMDSPGLRDAMDQFGSACSSAGFSGASDVTDSESGDLAG